MIIEKQFADLPEEFRKKLNISRPLYEAVSTADCTSGTRGRLAVFEAFSVDKDIEKIILAEPTDVRLYEAARKKGMIFMKEDAILKSMDKIVPFREINTL